ncbi:MAG: energy transducer TonB [Candidatus Acidiferrales bacterium]
MAEIRVEKVIPKTGEKGYAHPDCIRCPTPSYSDEGLSNRIQGSVVLTLVVMPDGRARYVRVLKGLGHGLDQAAVKAVLNWQFKPANGPDGKPAAVRMLIEVDFRLY